MPTVYIDTEFTDGNLYAGDLIEIAAVSDPSGNTFHTLVKPTGEVPREVEQLTGLTTAIVNKEGMTAANALEALDNFFYTEQESDNHLTTIVAHGGANSDFPILFASCIKNQTSLNSLKNASFLDSVKLLKKSGINRPGLATLCARYGIKNENRHSAYWDAYALKTVCEINARIIFSGKFQLTYDDIMTKVTRKMPVHPNVIATIAKHVCVSQLVKILDDMGVDNTALTGRTTLKIAKYFNCRARGW